ncbi:PREDICTED: defensin-like protein 1 [Ipomoea nil]|uniref:defensin-like protein 1 n=1 Tax=Ipomoea nil TaxID=35883 RepID=UPI000901A2D3|nr:PREDICTED: defensin-like protein 1 [Ipomoea nil]
MAKSYTTFVTLLFCFLITYTGIAARVSAPSPAPIESEGGEESLCERLSGSWSGQCFVTGNCDDHCRNYEGAVFGACHWNGFSAFSCFCYFNC